MRLNINLIFEMMRRNSIERNDLANLLGITTTYLYMLEKGKRKPSLSLTRRISKFTGVPLGKLLLEENTPEAGEKTETCDNENVPAEVKDELAGERHERLQAEKINMTLTLENERLVAVIGLHRRFEDISCGTPLSKEEKLKKLQELSRTAIMEGQLSFNDIRAVLRVKRAMLKNWLDAGKRVYECRFAEGGKIMAATPGEAALRLLCFNCEAFQANDCEGYGDEKNPENFFILLDRLKANGVYSRSDQSRVLKESYGMSLSPHEISELVYKYRHGIHVPDAILYMETTRRKRRRKS
jgi:transcriptional regulator with XRE-family HTH domain